MIHEGEVAHERTIRNNHLIGFVSSPSGELCELKIFRSGSTKMAPRIAPGEILVVA
jgi:hypothetical protein